ncbi:hypothetical protein [Tautonia rosea]|uniref:hypothetical protein n=1 Tax=Tautonia rosea TaxID=2728037 RepID=UPI001474834D|nr:hypothetical protein [Tautonia rosea]
MTVSDDSDDLAWLAFRYVTGELDDPTRSDFEARLLDDPEACAAVANAVGLIGVCLQIKSVDARERFVRPLRRRSVFALATIVAAASILLATISNPWNQPLGEPGGASEPPIALELAWVSLQREASLPFPEAEPEDWQVDPSAEDEVSMLEPNHEPTPNPPQWLLIAVDRVGDSSDSLLRPSEN